MPDMRDSREHEEQPRRQGRKLVYTVPEVAHLLGMGKTTLYRGIAEGTFPFPLVKVGTATRVLAAPLDRFLESGEHPKAGAA